LPAAVERWTRQIIACSPVAIEATKQSVYRGMDEPSLAAAIQNQDRYEKFAAWLASDDKREGPRAFAEKRAPRWSGHEQKD
jgi:enoyl-CoA hydratase/carnithine racemase